MLCSVHVRGRRETGIDRDMLLTGCCPCLGSGCPLVLEPGAWCVLRKHLIFEWRMHRPHIDDRRVTFLQNFRLLVGGFLKRLLSFG